MPRRRSETPAASLLGTWTDSDTAMQIVGTSLGLFGAGLEPGDVLSTETPLRNALFDVLLSLVEGGALEMRPTDDGRYAFRWRADYAVAGLTPGMSAAIDMEVPSPYLAELARMKRERDDALGRADFAEKVAAERERLLRLADVPSPAPRPAQRRAPQTPDALAALDPDDQSVLDVLYASRTEAEAPEEPKRTERAPRSRPAKRGSGRDPDGPDDHEPAAREPDIDLTDDDADTDAGEPSEVLYLTKPPATVSDDDASARALGDDDSPRPRWSGYTLDKGRSHLSSVDRLVDEG